MYVPKTVTFPTGIVSRDGSYILKPDGLDGFLVLLAVKILELISIEYKPASLPVL